MLPAHLQAIADKYDAQFNFSVTDVTPDWGAPGVVYNVQLSIEHKKAISELNELTTILKGNMDKSKRLVLEKKQTLLQYRVQEFEKYE